jgi:hypothetical protein
LAADQEGLFSLQWLERWPAILISLAIFPLDALGVSAYPKLTHRDRYRVTARPTYSHVEQNETNPPCFETADRTDFHRELGLTRCFARKGREIAPDLRRMG